MDERLLELELRLERTERRCRMLLALGAGVLGGSILLAGARPVVSQGNVLNAPFKVMGAAGKPLLELTADGEGPYLRMYDALGRRAATISAYKDGTTLALWARDKLLTQIFADEAGGAV